METKFESSVREIPYPQQAVYHRLSDLSLSEKVRDQLPEDKREDIIFAEDSITIDFTSAYGVPALKSLVRTMAFNREKNTVTITDKAAFSEPTTFEVPVITYRKWAKDADKMHFSFNKEKGNRTLGLDVTASAPVEFKSEKIENPDKPTPERLAFSFAQPVVEATISAVFSAGE